MSVFDTFLGNAGIVASLREMLAQDRLPQTLLFAGPEGIGKATLARLATAAMNCSRAAGSGCGECSACRRILESDLWRPEHQGLLAERAKMPPDKRRDNPLIISTYPEFLTFPPDGPLAQISIEQARRLKEHAQFGPSAGRRRVFLIDHADRIDAPAANSLLKVLEEPPSYLTVFLTAENAFDLLPTIRSRAVPFYFSPLSAREMDQFVSGRSEISAGDRAKVLHWAQGSPGWALSLDVATYEKRREAMVALLRAALKTSADSFAGLLRHTEALGRSKQEGLEQQLDVLYDLLHDLLRLQQDSPWVALINEDIRTDLAPLAARTGFDWIERALTAVDDLERLVRRNVQKQIALEALAVSLR
jgi:DNA polymerase-3 subunit delta'